MVHISTHLSKIVLKNKAALNAFANLFWRLAVAKLNSSPCFLLRYVLPTSAPLALSSLIRNSKTVKDLQDFIIVNAFVNKTGKCFILLLQGCFWSPPQKGYTTKEVSNIYNWNTNTSHKSLCCYFHVCLHDLTCKLSIDENFAFTWLTKR